MDYNNLHYFFTIKKLNAQQARWAEKLIVFDFLIEFCSGNLNPADALL
jgi:hypothetical protein